VVSKNLGQGKFTLSGLIGQTGTARLTTITNAPPGDYTIQFSDVPFYQTPLEQSTTLSNGGSVTFIGNYNFIDANRNGISDSWERYYFGAATINRTQFTDSDGDGMSDYAEFIAGTNPTNAASKLVFLSVTVLTNKQLQLSWAAIPGRLYQVQTSGLQPAPTPPRLSGSMANPANGFALHVDAATNFAYTVQVSTNLALWTAVYTNQAGGTMDWLDSTAAQSARRYYRTVALSSASTNLQGWTPVSEWLQASTSPIRFTTTSTNQGVQAYRVEVRP
jgi:hypothetical protein